VAGLAQALQVRGIPEQGRIAAMRDAVIRNQLGCIGFDLATELAGELITHQNRPSQLLPAGGLIPSPPCVTLITGAGLAGWCILKEPDARG
jgi:hypothetical protein